MFWLQRETTSNNVLSNRVVIIGISPVIAANLQVLTFVVQDSNYTTADSGTALLSAGISTDSNTINPSAGTNSDHSVNTEIVPPPHTSVSLLQPMVSTTGLVYATINLYYRSPMQLCYNQKIICNMIL